jgi:High potential iron-sulfur protein
VSAPPRRSTLTRRQLLSRLTLGAAAVPIAPAVLRSALAQEQLPLLSVTAAQAQAVKYVEDASAAHAAQPGSNCGNCALYQGKYGSSQGPCQIFPGKAVKAAGWCSSWAPQL